MTPPPRDLPADESAESGADAPAASPAASSPASSATSPGSVLSELRRRAREQVDGVRAVADARWGPPRDADRPVYLVAPAGHPNHGDEQLLAGWLRFLRHRLPGAQVVVDCHTPGQAAVLHHAEHPDVLFTDTLWRLAGEHTGADESIDFSRQAVADPGVRPALATGVELLRSASVVHLIGGGYVNDQWPHHLGVAAAAGEAGRLSGARVVATGQGLMPCGNVDRLSEAFRDFSLVAVRDAASHELFSGTDIPVRFCGDDGWLALTGPATLGPADHPVYSTDPDTCRDLVLCAQSDLGDPDALADAIAHTLAAWGVPGERMTVVESIPGSDRVVWDKVCARAATADVGGGGADGAGQNFGDNHVENNDDDDDEVGASLRALNLSRARFVPFQELWAAGLPARPGQTWLTTRFHPHLFAAARGASGVAVSVGSEYYDVKHGSLVAAGSPWSVVDAYTVPAIPVEGGFAPAAVNSLVAAAESLAEEIYPV